MLVVLLLFNACRKPEPEERADYFVDNRTGHHLTVGMVPHWPTDALLVTDSVAAEQRVLIFRAVQGSGGHTLPSNFFKEFSLLAGDSVVYSGVRNGDWQREGPIDDRHQLTLVVD